MSDGSYSSPPPPPPPPPPQFDPTRQPGPPPQAQPPKKSRKVWWLVGCGCLSVVGIVIVMGVVLVMIGLFSPSKTTTTVGEDGVASTTSGGGVMTSDPKEKLKGFLELLGEGNAETAYREYTSPGFRHRETQEQFVGMAKGYPGLKDRQASTFQWNREGETFTVTGELITSDGTYGFEASMVLVKGSWLIDDFVLKKDQ